MSGLNDFAENGEMRLGLRAPFPPKLVSQLPATQKRPTLSYVSHAAVTDRLNTEAPGWTWEPTRFIEFTDPNGFVHLQAVFGWMEIGSVRRYEVGQADGLDDWGREMKGAISDFIRRAAMRFGVALDLWAKEDLQQATRHEADRATLPAPVSGESTARLEGAQVAQDAASPALSVPGGADTTEGPGEQAGRPDASGPSTFDPDSPATQEQWHALLQMAGSKTKALNRINKANKVSYTQATSISATASELAAAIEEASA